MKALIAEITQNSIADEIGLKCGDKLLKINDIKPVDLIDYKYAICAEEITIEIKKNNGQIEIIEIEKEFDEDLGIVFNSAVFDEVKPCRNKCIFCFVDQQPDGLRSTLYVKDDDYRLSYLQGTYITLTNLDVKDRKRIEKLRLGPLYVSIHTTNGDLRVKMLKNPRAKDILNDLDWLKKIDIPIHTQIVLCPNFNDGKELEHTLNDLAKYKKIIKSIAIVPVGTTKFRKKPLKTVNEKIAIQTIDIIDKFNKKIKRNLACASDEFFILAKKEIPQKKYYGDFAQLEDGVGALRLLIDDFEKRKKKLPKKIKNQKTFHLIGSKASETVFLPLIEELNKVENLNINYRTIKSNFWGEDISVAGLIVGNDILEHFLPLKNELTDLVLPSVMVRELSNDFLDGITVAEIEKQLNCKIHLIKDFYSTKELFALIN